MLVKNIISVVMVAAVIVVVLSLIAVLLAGWEVKRKTMSCITRDVSRLPSCEAALVLGTSKWLADGGTNPYFRYRIDAAAKLYHSGKIKYIVVSGDNSHAEDNEPGDMRHDLVALGIPAEGIYMDYAGFRTLDSVVRMSEVFGQRRYIVVSQEFHNERAIYIARWKGMEVWGFDATDVPVSYGIKTHIREQFARVKMFLDLFFGKQPKFLGPKVELGEPQEV